MFTQTLVVCSVAALCLQPSLCKVSTMTIAPGLEMPMLALGTYRDSLKGCSVIDAVDQWLKLGGRHIDTAFSYGTQPDVGKALRKSSVPRNEIFLTTKIPGPIGKDNVTKLIRDTSLPQLGVDQIDLVLIHWPCNGDSQFPDKCSRSDWRAERLSTWQGLMELQKAGKIKAIGVSNYNTEHVTELLEAGLQKPSVNQVQWHLGFHNETLVTEMKSLGVAVEAWAPLAGPTNITGGIPLSDERLQSVAQRYNASTAQVALRWSTQRGVTPVTATCKRDHALGDLASFNVDLAEEDISYLNSLTMIARNEVIV